MPLLDAFKIDRFKVDGGGGLGIKSIQTGYGLITGTDSSLAIPVTAVDVQKAALIFNGFSVNDTEPYYCPWIELTDAETVTLKRKKPSTSKTTIAGFTLIEFENVKSIQYGSLTFKNAFEATATINNVDVTKSWCLFNGSGDIGYDSWGLLGLVVLDSPTTVKVIKASNANYYSTTYFCVVEFK